MTVTNYALIVSKETTEEMPTVLYIQSHQLRFENNTSQIHSAESI